jgi:hypothetical protein
MQGSIESSHVRNLYKKGKAGGVGTALPHSPRFLKAVKSTYFDFSALNCDAKCANLILEFGRDLPS